MAVEAILFDFNLPYFENDKLYFHILFYLISTFKNTKIFSRKYLENKFGGMSIDIMERNLIVSTEISFVPDLSFFRNLT